jgi:peroxiredoxin Q/BCP
VDAVEAQKKHAIQCAADFPILSDKDKKLTTELGILRDTGTAMRTTYVLDGAGTVRKVFEGVTVDGHVDQVLNAVKEL